MTTVEGIKSIGELDLEHQRVFMRVDYNVPLDKSSNITSDARIRASLPTLKYAVEQGARLVLASHLGRPKGQHVPEYSLEPVAVRLSELTGWDVLLPDDCIGEAVKRVVMDQREGQVVLLENLRFHAEEASDDETFARELGKYCDIYINDAFGSSHRAHASVHALAKQMRDRAMGLLVQTELRAFEKIARSASQPFVAVLGGAKVADKIGVLEALLQRCQTLCIGGAMANTLLAARGADMQASRIEQDWLPRARSLLEKAMRRDVDIVLPTDIVAAESTDAPSGETVNVGQLSRKQMALDIGPETVEAFSHRIRRAKTVFWNGPMGLFENAAFAAGTQAIAQQLADCAGFTVVGGGDSVAALETGGEVLTKNIDHISTGGGASLELLEGKTLPGIEILRSQ